MTKVLGLLQQPVLPEGPAWLVAIALVCWAGVMIARAIRDTMRPSGGGEGFAERQRILDRIDQAERAIQAATKELGENTDDTRHELRNHLTTIIGQQHEALHLLDQVRSLLLRKEER